jgi:hypothetical protein
MEATQMRKFLNLFLLLSLLLMLSVSPVAFAQEGSEGTADATAQPTDQPAEQPTAQPTDQPTDQPTQQPTDQPTDQPTQQPTDQPTDQPTQQPTDQPTDQPTQQPTDTATPEPTTQPTDTPTVEPTTEITPTVTVEPTTEITPTATVTTTVEVSPTVEVQGEIGTAAVVGSWSSEYIAIQNLGSSLANVALKLYQSSATEVQTISPGSIPVGGNITILGTQITNNGRYSGILSSNELVGVYALQRNSTYGVAEIHPGLPSGNVAQELIISRVFKNHFGYTTEIHIQNAHSSAQTINLKLYKIGESTPRVDQDFPNVPANTSFDVKVVDFANYPSGNDVSLGYARVKGLSGNVAAVADSIRDTGKPLETVQVSLPGLPESAAAGQGEMLILPRVFNAYFSWDTGIPVVNLSSVSTNVTLTFVDQNGASRSKTLAAGPNAGLSFFLPTDFSNAKNTYGGVSVSCDAPGCKIIAVGNSVYHGQNSSDPNGAGNTPAMKSSLATNRAAVPLVFRQGSNLASSNWTTGVVVYNIDNGTVTTRWVKANTDPNVAGNSVTWQQTGAAGKVSTFFAPDNAALNNFGIGSVEISSTGRIMVVATYNLQAARGQAAAFSY